MLTIAYYFTQVILCSGIMMGYYWLVLRNKRFHYYNRFYLLAITLLAWVVPLVKIRWGYTPVSNDLQVVQLLSVVADNNSDIEAAISRKSFEWNWEMAAWGIYLTVAAVLLSGMVWAFIRLYRLLKVHSCKNVGDVYLVLTQAKGTPFSFFRYIFWNEEIDLHSETGKQILQHELTHVQEKHSADKIIIQLVLVAGWFNPFFWVLKKEMEMIHEFIADKKAVGNGDTASLAQMLLTAAYPQQQFALTHPFFFSPIKRRLQMLTNTRNPRFSYLRRLVVLPLLAVVVVLFAFRSKEQRARGPISVATMMEKVVDVVAGNQPQPGISVSNIAMLERVYTVVIHPGHGGDDPGFVGADGTSESVLTLQLAKAVSEMNDNENIRIILTRTEDEYLTPRKTVEIANQYHPDLFLSLHLNSVNPVELSSGKTKENSKSGIEFYIPEKAKSNHYLASQMLASEIANAMSPLNEKILGIKTRKNGLQWLEKIESAGVLMEAGFITNTRDLANLKEYDYQKKMAISILNGVNEYLVKSKKSKIDTVIAKADTITVKSGTNLMITSEGGKVQIEDVTKTAATDPQNTLTNVLVIIDGKKVDKDILNLIDPAKIQAVNVLKNESATALYGEEGKNGVVIITTKKNETQPGRAVAASGYVARNTGAATLFPSGRPLNGSVGQFGAKVSAVPQYADTLIWQSGNDSYKIPNNIWVLIDGEPGNLNDVKPAEIAEVRVIKDASAVVKYGEAAKNGVVEVITKKAAESMKSVSPPNFRKQLEGHKVFTQAEALPEFPGGQAAWVKYLERNMNRDIVLKKGGPPGKYTVTVSFIIAADGGVSNITAQNNPGYGTAEEAIRLIRNGPRWKPAMQNGVPVNYRHKQAFTWVIKTSRNQ